jgi:hypothetical protein
MKTQLINNKHCTECDVVMLPTNKKSDLFICNDMLTYTNKHQNILAGVKNYPVVYQHLYILSNDEIKEGGYGINGYGELVRLISKIGDEVKVIRISDGCEIVGGFLPKKIIATTDSDLIKDGVQAIDDEFLEWFVQNQSCEKVEVLMEYKDGYGNWYKYDKEFWDKHDNKPKFGTRYKIIIPQEEPKKETLDEAALKVYPDYSCNSFDTLASHNRRVWIKGAKWQAERMYSEEDLRKAFKAGVKYSISFMKEDGSSSEPNVDEWIKQNLK